MQEQEPHSDSLEALQQYIGESATLLEVVPDEAMRAELSIMMLHELGNRAESLARQIGMTAIEEGTLSAAKVAQRLGVAQSTMSRWRHAEPSQTD